MGFIEHIKGDSAISKLEAINTALVPVADLTLQVFAEQVAADIAYYITHVILPDVNCPENLTWRDIRALLLIHVFPDGLTPSTVARYTRYDPATVLRLYEELADCDFAYQVSNPLDARSLIIKSTSAGREFVDRFFVQYNLQRQSLIPSRLPRYGQDELIDIFQSCFALQERAELLASIAPNGRIKFKNTIGQSLDRYNENFQFYSAFPDFALHLICKNISEDYIKFLNAHVIKALLKPTKLRIRELRVLMCLHHNAAPKLPSKIAKTMRMDPATVTRAVKILSEGGYLVISESLRDERSKPLTITDKGMSLTSEYVERVDGAVSFAEAASGQSFSELRREEFLGTLITLRQRAQVFATSNRTKPMATPNFALGGSFGL